MAIGLTIPFSSKVPGQVRAPDDGLESKIKARGAQQIGERVARMGDVVFEWQRRRDATALEDASAQLEVWANKTVGDLQNLPDDQLSDVNPDTQELGFERAGKQFKEQWNNQLSALGSRLGRQGQQELSRSAQIGYEKWRDRLATGMLKREVEANQSRIRGRIAELAVSDRETLYKYAPTAIEKWFPASERGRQMDYAQQQDYLHLIRSDPSLALATLEAQGSKRFDNPNVYESLVQHAKSQQRVLASEMMAVSLDEAGKLAVGTPEEGIMGDPTGAWSVIDNASKSLPDKYQVEFRQNGAKSIATAMLAQDAKQAYDWIESHASELEPSDRINLRNHALYAIDKMGGSTGEQNIQAQTALFERMGDPSAYADTYQKVKDFLTPQARIEMGRRVAMRDSVNVTQPDVLARSLMTVGGYYVTQDKYVAQRELADARFGNVRHVVSEEDQALAFTSGETVGPQLSKEDYTELQNLVNAKVPVGKAIGLQQGITAIVSAMSDANGAFDDYSAKAALEASKDLIARLQDSPASYPDEQSIYRAAIDIASAKRPNTPVSLNTSVEPVHVEQKVPPFSGIRNVDWTSVNQMIGMGTVKSKSKMFEDILTTDEERQQAKTLRRQGLAEPQIIEKMAPNLFPKSWWKQIESDPEIKNSVLKDLANHVPPAQIMLDLTPAKEGK